VLHNGRFSMPAGQYRVDVHFAANIPPDTPPEQMNLQVGRLGNAMRSWQVRPMTDGHFVTTMDLPLDAGFVGFTGSAALERAIAAITLTPTAIVDRSRRLSAPQVLAAAQYGTVTVLFHDFRAYPERTGFWTIGEQRMRFAIADTVDTGDQMRLLLRSGPQANHVEISTTGWKQAVDLQPETDSFVTLPKSTRRVIELEIETSRAFVPGRVDPSSRDMRRLGAWVEVQPLAGSGREK
jgi:hypothetical protein